MSINTVQKNKNSSITYQTPSNDRKRQKQNGKNMLAFIDSYDLFFLYSLKFIKNIIEMKA